MLIVNIGKVLDVNSIIIVIYCVLISNTCYVNVFILLYIYICERTT